MKQKRGFIVVHTKEGSFEEYFEEYQALLAQTFEERIGAAVEATLRKHGEVSNPEPGSPEWLDKEIRSLLIYLRDAIGQSTNPAETRRLNDVAIASYEMGWAAAMGDVPRWYRAKGKKGGQAKESEDPLAELAIHRAAGLGEVASIKAMATTAGIEPESVKRALRRARARKK